MTLSLSLSLSVEILFEAEGVGGEDDGRGNGCRVVGAVGDALGDEGRRFFISEEERLSLVFDVDFGKEGREEPERG